MVNTQAQAEALVRMIKRYVEPARFTIVGLAFSAGVDTDTARAAVAQMDHAGAWAATVGWRAIGLGATRKLEGTVEMHLRCFFWPDANSSGDDSDDEEMYGDSAWVAILTERGAPEVSKPPPLSLSL
jgi:hypothetical protein